MILCLRTDKPEAELYLFDGTTEKAVLRWQAHTELSKTIHLKIEELFAQAQIAYDDLTGIVVFQGPGSFTGLRIGITVANALAYSLAIPIAAGQGEQWTQKGIQELLEAPSRDPVMPEYGAEPNITQPRK